jgi:hypothetical protein
VSTVCEPEEGDRLPDDDRLRHYLGVGSRLEYNHELLGLQLLLEQYALRGARGDDLKRYLAAVLAHSKKKRAGRVLRQCEIKRKGMLPGQDIASQAFDVDGGVQEGCKASGCF